MHYQSLHINLNTGTVELNQYALEIGMMSICRIGLIVPK